MTQELENRIITEIKTVYDPEIPVNIYDLGLIYNLKEEKGILEIEMTLTAPNCPVADNILAEVKGKTELIPEISETKINLVFEPEWDMNMMTEEAKLELGML